jgi:signal transduction histidine kinase/ActR/RegA family two-component response regulator
MKHVEGDLVWVESNIRLLRDEAGAPREMVMVTRDIRERRRLEEQLRAALARAEASVEAKTEFLANMSHEIRTPLTAIIGFSDLLSGCSGLPSQAEHYVRRIQTAGIGLLSVVNDILDFSKLEAGHVELDPRSFEPLAFVEETLELVEAQAANKGLCVRFAPAGDIPEWVLADSSRLRQILLNLLTNAIKFTSKGGVEVGMTYSAHADGVLRIEVTDTGPGVPSAQRSRLFQRFSQGDSSTSRRHGGTGLGLAICKSLAELMGGSIGVKSRVGRGSTFWFTVRAPIAQPALSLAPDPPVRAEERPERPARILLVDDVAANREVAIALLSPFGHEFAEAQNGADAVGLAMKTPFDLILMDLNMPGMDGLAAARAIRASSEVNGRTPILALSANVRDVEVKACRAAGMSDHIAKPIAVQDLLCKVAQWLDADAAA